MTVSLVTGGAGFIGSHIVDALLARGDQVRVLDDLSTGKLRNLQGAGDQVEVIEADLRDPDVLEKALRGVNLVFHQAAFVSVPQSMEEPDLCLDINIRGTSQLLEASRRFGIQRVVLASSAAVYGENSDLPLSEGAATDPLSPYAASKLIDEILARLYTNQLGLDVVALRYFNVYGPRQNPASVYAAVIPIFIRRLLDEEEPVVYGDGGQTRDFIYVADVVRANLIAADSRSAAGRTMNICSGQETSLLDLIESLSILFNREIQPDFQEPRAGDIYRSLGDPSLSGELLEFAPRVSLLEGLESTLKWMAGTVHD
ncbi:MAG: NAD-dependent epimerase/dehydratase family protein [Anaerolineales bacterium]